MTKKKQDDLNDLLASLKGFEELIQGKKIRPKKVRKDEEFNISTFIEQNSRRLDLFYEFLTNKINIVDNYPQDITLLQEQEENNQVLLSHLVQNFVQKDSPVELSFKKLWDEHFLSSS